MALRFLVCDAYDVAGRESLAAAGCTAAGELYARLLRRLQPGCEVGIAFPADAGGDPDHALAGADGVVWTGSSLTIHRERDPRIRRQLALCRAAFAAGVPQFGSCFAAQLAVTAAGGSCAPNPKGREFGVAAGITPNAEGKAHPLFQGKAIPFDALTSHEDEVVRLPPGATVLASNAWSAVQAVDVRHARGVFWAVQYHPEYDLREVARLTALRKTQLIAQGRFRDDADAADWAARMEAIEAGQGDAAGLDPGVADAAARSREVANWIAHQVEGRR